MSKKNREDFENREEEEVDEKEMLDEFADLQGDKDESGAVEGIKELNNPRNIQLKTQMERKLGEPHYYAKLQVLGFLLGWKELDCYVDNILKNKVSSDRQGRKESVEILKAPSLNTEKPNFMKRMFS